MSSQYSENNALSDCHAAINGNTSNVYVLTPVKQNCIHTDDEDRTPWWWVDMGNEYTLYWIRIYVREKQRHRMRNLQVYVDQTHVLDYGDNVPPQNSKYIDIHNGTLPVTGRYLNISRHATSEYFLNICEVQVVLMGTTDRPVRSVVLDVWGARVVLTVTVVVNQDTRQTNVIKSAHQVFTDSPVGSSVVTAVSMTRATMSTDVHLVTTDRPVRSVVLDVWEARVIRTVTVAVHQDGSLKPAVWVVLLVTTDRPVRSAVLDVWGTSVLLMVTVPVIRDGSRGTAPN
ncbi:hypothetical protein BaRGS_00030189, partial [Batillaria attramentaria]